MGYSINGTTPGGGASLPTTPAGALLDASRPNQIVTLDGSGAGTGTTVASLGSSLVSSRRAALPDFGLLWECNESSGDFINTGSVGTSANLTTVGSGCSRSQLGPITLGRGARFDGSADGYAKGAAGATPGTGSDTSLTVFAVAVIGSDPGSRKDILSRSYELPELPPPYVAVTLTVISATSWLAKFGISGSYQEIYSDIPYQIGKQHVFGATYDGTHVKLWLDGVLAKTSSLPGAVSWGTGTGLWWLGSNPGGASTNSLICRAGAANVVWGTQEWGEFVEKTNGNWGA